MSAPAVTHRERLALRLLQNWTALHPTDTIPAATSVNVGSPQPAGEAVIDDSLTSLTWLQNLNVMKLASGTSTNGSARTPTPGSGGQRPTGAVQPIQQQQQRKSLPHVDPNVILDMTGVSRTSVPGSTRVKSEPASPTNSRSPSLPRLSPPPPPPRCTDTGGLSPPLPALQRTDTASTTPVAATKPNHSYATLICMAMNDSADQRVTLNNIYNWIVDNFPYFRTADPSWQNSIRHNLSLNKCFQRVQREKSDPGKGSYWTINPEFQSIVERDFFRKRPATSPGSGGPAAKKVCRRATVDDGHRSTGSFTQTSRRDVSAAAQTTDVDEFLNDLDADDSLADGLDMSWSTILGRSLSCPSGQSLYTGSGHATQSGTESSQQRVTESATADSASQPPSRPDNDAELDELIRACADTDPGMLDELGLDVDIDSLDLTIHGIGLRPPDWWSSLCDSFDAGGSGTAPSGDATATRRLSGLNTPSPSPAAPETENTGRQQQQQPHPWAEHRGLASIHPSLDSSIDTLGLLAAGPSTPFDSDVADEF